MTIGDQEATAAGVKFSSPATNIGNYERRQREKTEAAQNRVLEEVRGKGFSITYPEDFSL